MGNSLRKQPLPSIFGPEKTPVTVDLLEVKLVYYILVMVVCFIVIIPGIRGWEVRTVVSSSIALILRVRSYYGYSTIIIIRVAPQA